MSMAERYQNSPNVVPLVSGVRLIDVAFGEYSGYAGRTGVQWNECTQTRFPLNDKQEV